MGAFTGAATGTVRGAAVGALTGLAAGAVTLFVTGARSGVAMGVVGDRMGAELTNPTVRKSWRNFMLYLS